MSTEQEMKDWIDNATYEQLLQKWRFAPAGSVWFMDDIGQYFKRVMLEKKKDADHVQASKNVGW